jgi:hypothetical protein
MKRLMILGSIAAGLLLSSCSKKTPEFVNSIPENAVGVLSLNPMQIHTKGKLASIESLKEKFKDEVWGLILEDPLSTGLKLDEYVFIFANMEETGPVIGVISGMKDREKFESILGKIKEDISSEFKTGEGYTYVQPDNEGIIAWNEEQMIILACPEGEALETSYYTGKLDWMFHPVKEESITSLVNFKEFLGKMKDMNVWLSSDDLQEVIKEIAPDEMQFDLPVALNNNYAQIFVEFDNGALKVNGETFFSEEVGTNYRNW